MVDEQLRSGVRVEDLEGCDGPLADAVRERYPGMVIHNLLVEYAVPEPFQEDRPEHVR